MGGGEAAAYCPTPLNPPLNLSVKEPLEYHQLVLNILFVS